MKIRVLYTLTNLSGGGAERIGVNLLKNFNRHRFLFDLFLHKKQGSFLNELPDSIKLHYFLKEIVNPHIGKIISFVTLPFLLFKLIFISRNYDILIAGLESTYVTYATILSGALNKKPVIVTVHIDIFHNMALRNSIHLRIIKWLYPYCSHCVCVSKGVMDGVIKEVPKMKNKISVIYNPIDVYEIQDKAKEPIETHIKGPYIIGVGRLERQKRFDILIQAHKKVIDAGISHSLLILGEGNCRDDLTLLIDSLKLQSVLLVGFDNNPYKWVSKAHCLVLSSENEGFGNVIVEALAVGTPVISTNCPSGPAEILRDGEYGLLVSNKSVDELASGIISMFRNTALHDKFKLLSTERAEIFSTNKAIAQWDILLEKTIKKG